MDDPLDSHEPLALMMQALERAADDCGRRELLARADSIFVPKGMWPYSNPGALIARQLGVEQARTGLATLSGSKVQQMVSAAARDIAEGRSQVTLVVGAECERSKRRAKRGGVALEWTEQLDSTPDEDFGPDGPLIDPIEVERGLRQPAAVFSLFDNAMRHARGESLEAHRARISRLWSGFSEVAATNAYAWTREPLAAKEIGKPSPANRLVAHPYTMRLCSNMVVDQGAALILCSEEMADRLGIARDRRIYLHAASDLRKTLPLGSRTDLRSAPFMRHAGMRALSLAGVGIDEIAHLDLYSCFPAAVQLGMDAFGIDEDRVPTITGGLGFAGGPFNSYVLHSIATMMNVLREDPEELGLISSIGGWLAKHAFGVYGARPPAQGFCYADCDLEALPIAARPFDANATGEAVIETYLLSFDQGEPVGATFSCLFEDGRRNWATSDDTALFEAMQREEFCGRAAHVRRGSVLELP
ncbi:MAG: hypothetical protein JRH16_23770 [Deltaproteobacteria bacterium]|nr:hypothetical protein [Deltaproteobacteria bacterium]